MCNERERLIGYVYDECDPAERSAVQEHLASCADCRTEIASLRSVRNDLQSWDVPDHESVWKPFTPAPDPAWWQQVPRWAMAAAAGAVIVSGAAGGALAHAMMPHEASVLAAVPAGATQAGPVLTAADLVELERRMDTKFLALVNQVDARVQLASSRQTPTDVEAFHRAFDQELRALRAKDEEQLKAIQFINANFGNYRKSFEIQQGYVKNRLDNLIIALDQGR